MYSLNPFDTLKPARMTIDYWILSGPIRLHLKEWVWESCAHLFRFGGGQHVFGKTLLDVVGWGWWADLSMTFWATFTFEGKLLAALSMGSSFPLCCHICFLGCLSMEESLASVNCKNCKASLVQIIGLITYWSEQSAAKR